MLTCSISTGVSHNVNDGDVLLKRDCKTVHTKTLKLKKLNGI